MAAKEALGNQTNYGGALGLDFDVDGRVVIGFLGAFDSGSDGFTNPITVQVWARDNGGTPEDPADDFASDATPLVETVINPR